MTQKASVVQWAVEMDTTGQIVWGWLNENELALIERYDDEVVTALRQFINLAVRAYAYLRDVETARLEWLVIPEPKEEADAPEVEAAASE